MAIYSNPEASQTSKKSSPATPVVTRIGVIDNHVAASRSCIHLLEDLLAPQIKSAVEKTLEHGLEFAISTAYPDGETAASQDSYPTHHGYVAGPTAGSSGTVTTGLPAALSPHTPSTHDTEVLQVPASRTPCDYRDFIKLHTHPPHDRGRVGLSHNDLVDNVPGKDKHTSDSPFDIYRATGAIVFAPPISRRLPEPIGKAVDNGQLTEENIDSLEIFDKRPENAPGRVWIHFVERTDAAVSLSQTELTTLHRQTLDTPIPKNHSLRNIRRVLGKTVIEGFFPISP